VSIDHNADFFFDSQSDAQNCVENYNITAKFLSLENCVLETKNCALLASFLAAFLTYFVAAMSIIINVSVRLSLCL
jgi:hypothetical protein